MHLYPSWMVFRCGCLSKAHRLQSTLFVDLLVTPYPVCPHIRAVEIGLRGIEDHAVNRSLVAVLEVLDILFDVARRVDREDVPVASIVVERVAVYGVRRLLSGEEKDGARLRVGIICFGCEARQS
jgi:hypothetical protein